MNKTVALQSTIASLIFDYIKNNLSLSLNDKRRKILWVGKEFENDITWSYLEFKNVKKREKRVILCSVLNNELF